MEKKALTEISKSEDDPFNLVYYGSPSNLINLTLVKAKKLPYDRNLIIDEKTNSTISSGLLNKVAHRHLGPEYFNFHIAALPCNDLIYKTHDVELSHCENTEDNLLDFAMIKVDHDISSEFTGYQSGERSAIIKFNNGRYYRLKGCGNQLNGFTLRQMGFPKDGIELRGCQFRHTANREAYMSDKINEVLNKFGFQVGNKPVGVWLYSEIESKEKKLEDSLKRIDKFCSVYEIVSEKRLGVHLYSTIELILFEYLKKFIGDVNNDNDNYRKTNYYKEVIADLYPQSRIVYKNSKDSASDSKEIFEIEPTTTYVPNIELVREDGDTLNSLFDKYKIYEEHENNLTSIFKVIEEKSLTNEILKLMSNPEIFKEILTKLLTDKNIYQIFTQKVNSRSEEIINSKIEKIYKNLNEKSKFSLLELIGLIYARTGWESGKMKRIMQNHDINWGTYEDLPFRLHCNAHTDNYVISPRNKNNNKNLLCIVDFDMAFFRKNFFNIDDENNKERYGNPDDFLFDNYLNMERVYLEWEFSGSENVISLEIAKNVMKENPQYEFSFKNFIHLLRDTAVTFYREGYLLKEFSLEQRYSNLYEDIYDLIDLALLAGHDLIG
jgi:hypothetical protein